MNQRLFFVAGEASGDLHGAGLIEAILRASPTSTMMGMGGVRMRSLPFQSLFNTEDYSVMGFSAVFRSLPRLMRLFYRLRHAILNEQPDGVVLIDYPGLNLRLAQSLRKNGYQGKLIQYIAPTVWAHGKKRAAIIEKNYDLLLTLFPFEPPYFSSTNLEVYHTGHPLTVSMDQVSPTPSEWQASRGLYPTYCALFPGSRVEEIKRHLPFQLEVALHFQKQTGVRIGVSSAHPSLNPLIEKFMSQAPTLECTLIPHTETQWLMQKATVALAKSGTVTLELACRQIPTFVHYHPTRLNTWIAQSVLKLSLPHYCIVNILGGEEIFPELITPSYPPPSGIAYALQKLLQDTALRSSIQNKCAKIKSLLHQNAPYDQAARLVLNTLSHS